MILGLLSLAIFLAKRNHLVSFAMIWILINLVIESSIIPLEMISVLAQYTVDKAGLFGKRPAIGLFAGQEIRLINGPIFVNHPYQVEREIIALSESRRTESSWIRSRIYDKATRDLVCEMVLNSAVLKDSYPNYEKDALALGKDLN